jgi:multidrug transporter EmrE-like cation transporter
MLSVGYIVNAAAAVFLFGEALTTPKVVGILLIVGGVIVLARAAP